VTKGKTNNKERSVRKAVKKGHSAPDVIRDLDEYRDVYQDLFDHVPCFITVQDRNYKLLRYNREFEESFDPKGGAHCYQAYKRRDEKCIICPVEKTFEDGLSHWSEEFGPNKHGETLHWVVKTSPIKNAKGEIIAVMEMCLDITHRKKLEEELEISERKYRAIFNNIPNPLFVLDAESLGIIDCKT
jgi:histidine kinase